MLGKAPPEGKDRLEALNAELIKLLDLPGGGSMARPEGLSAAGHPRLPGQQGIAPAASRAGPGIPGGRGCPVAVTDLEHLRPVGAAPAGKAAELLDPDLMPATGRKFNGKVMLRPEIRAETISGLVAADRIEDALAANPDERDGALQAHLERYLRHEAPPLAGAVPGRA